ncbi:MAG: pyridoxal phosphate-dependent aminotransferase [Clostridia bacterium]|nr:pyridoxal phosphate-dependent aminotransferase [Clostridia bacterium]
MVNEKSKELGSNPSVIRDLFEYGKKRKQEIGENKVFDFSIGNPSVPPPKSITNALISLLQTSNPTTLHGYTSAVGDKGVREAISDYLNKTYDTKTTADLIYLTAGAAASLTITLNAVLNKDDEVIVFAPFFPEYTVFIEKAGGVVKVVEPIKTNFTPNLEMLEKTITKKTKAVIINSPNNPTGVMLKEEDIKVICAILNKKQKEFNSTIYLISDEPYRELVYTQDKYPFITNYYKDSIVCYSFSKSVSLPGERIGYILVSPQTLNAKEVFAAICGAGRALGFVCAPALFQYLIPHCLGKTSDLSVYKKNRDLLSSALIEYGYEVVSPDGAFYLFVKALEEDAVAFSENAKQFELLLVPSNSFGLEGYTRISYCVSTKQIKNSLPAFKKLIDFYKNKSEK